MVVVRVGAGLFEAENDKVTSGGLLVFLKDLHDAGGDVDSSLTAGAFGGAKFSRLNGEGVFFGIEVLP